MKEEEEEDDVTFGDGVGLGWGSVGFGDVFDIRIGATD